MRFLLTYLTIIFSQFLGIAQPLDSLKIQALVPVKYDSIIDQKTYPYYYVVKDGKMGVYEIEKDKEVISPQYEFIGQTRYNSNARDIGNFIILQNGKFGIVNYRGKEVLPAEYDAISSWVEYGPEGHYVKKNEKFGLARPNGRLFVPTEYQMIYYKSAAFIKVMQNGKVGVVDSRNHTVIPITNDKLILDIFWWDAYEDHRIWLKNSETWTELNVDGEVLRKHVPENEVILEFGRDRINNSDFEYVESMMIYPESLKK